LPRKKLARKHLARKKLAAKKIGANKFGAKKRAFFVENLGQVSLLAHRPVQFVDGIRCSGYEIFFQLISNLFFVK
jgi:hypothetical protein